MKSLVVAEKDAGQTLRKFLTKNFPKLPVSLMYKELRKKNIKINNRRATADTVLHEGDLLQLYTNDDVLTPREKYYDFTSASSKLDIIYEDADIMVIDKPRGVLCHPAGGDYTDNIIARVQKYLYEKKEWDPSESIFTPALANRLDRNTSGLILAAKNSDALRFLNEKIKTHEIEKYYLALVEGTPPKVADTVTSYLTKNEKTNMVSVFENYTPGSKKIITEYRVVKSGEGRSLLEINLKTGRTHQIRAQLAALGMPVVGDGKYGTAKGRSRQMLCSYRLYFNFETAGRFSHLSHAEFISKKCDFINSVQ